jgi:hypothetical protein
LYRTMMSLRPPKPRRAEPRGSLICRCGLLGLMPGLTFSNELISRDEGLRKPNSFDDNVPFSGRAFLNCLSRRVFFVLRTLRARPSLDCDFACLLYGMLRK